jgi:hypothetical protein
MCGLQFEGCSESAIVLQGTKKPVLKSPGLTLVHSRFLGNIGTDGGDVNAQGAALNICGCRFRDSNARNGGALYLSESQAVIRHCLFYNTTQNDGTGGGAISLQFASSAKVSYSTFAYNVANSGSSIDLADSSLEVSDCRFLQSRLGSAVTVTDPIKFTVKNTTFRNCTSGGSGGAVNMQYNAPAASEAIFERVTFEECRSDNQGGAVYVDQPGEGPSAVVRIVDSSFTGCEVSA